MTGEYGRACGLGLLPMLTVGSFRVSWFIPKMLVYSIYLGPRGASKLLLSRAQVYTIELHGPFGIDNKSSQAPS